MSLQSYEAAKAAWVRAHPRATPRQYEQAMTELAKKHRI